MKPLCAQLKHLKYKLYKCISSRWCMYMPIDWFRVEFKGKNWLGLLFWRPPHPSDQTQCPAVGKVVGNTERDDVSMFQHLIVGFSLSKKRWYFFNTFKGIWDPSISRSITLDEHEKIKLLKKILRHELCSILVICTLYRRNPRCKTTYRKTTAAKIIDSPENLLLRIILHALPEIK